jgi:hypothetical protein
MGLETATYVGDLVGTNPTGGDNPRLGDDHLRLIKDVLKNSFPDLLSSAWDKLYPVGSIYINATNTTNPDTLLGFGTWVAFGGGKVPVGYTGADALFNAGEKTGGSKNSVVVSHNHGLFSGSAGSHTPTGVTDTEPDHLHSSHGHSSVNLDGGPFAMSGASVVAGNTGSAGAHSHALVMDAVGAHQHSISTDGVSGTDANLQPFITVFMWKRTA